MSNAVIAFCGLDCATCPAFRAGERLTLDERRQVAEKWSADFGEQMTAEQIDCVGCTFTEGAMIPYCAVCETRLCALGKGYTTCADCPDYSCESLEKLLANTPEARVTLDALRAARPN